MTCTFLLRVLHFFTHMAYSAKWFIHFILVLYFQHFSPLSLKSLISSTVCLFWKKLFFIKFHDLSYVDV